MADLLFEDEVFRIRGAVFDVHNEMGNGFLEAAYQECLEKELARSAVPYVSHPVLNFTDKGEPLVQVYQRDLVCFDKIIVELKAATSIASEHLAQVMNYLKATGLRLGLIINFGTYPEAQIERIAL